MEMSSCRLVNMEVSSSVGMSVENKLLVEFGSGKDELEQTELLVEPILGSHSTKPPRNADDEFVVEDDPPNRPLLLPVTALSRIHGFTLAGASRR